MKNEFKSAVTVYLIWLMDNLEFIGWEYPEGYTIIYGSLDVFGAMQFLVVFALFCHGVITQRKWLIIGSAFGFLMGVSILVRKWLWGC